MNCENTVAEADCKLGVGVEGTKSVYAPPQLQVYGSVGLLTQNGTGSGTDGGTTAGMTMGA